VRGERVEAGRGAGFADGYATAKPKREAVMAAVIDALLGMLRWGIANPAAGIPLAILGRAPYAYARPLPDVPVVPPRQPDRRQPARPTGRPPARAPAPHPVLALQAD
jgi:hypothetical protein